MFCPPSEKVDRPHNSWYTLVPPLAKYALIPHALEANPAQCIRQILHFELRIRISKPYTPAPRLVGDFCPFFLELSGKFLAERKQDNIMVQQHRDPDIVEPERVDL